MKNRGIFSLFVSFFAISAYGVPADPTPRTLTQPDGREELVQLVGDEHFSYFTRVSDGTPMRLSDNGMLVEDFTLPERASEKLRSVRRAGQHTAIGGDFPTTGAPRSLVLLVGFKDESFAQTRTDFDNLLNQSGYSYNGANGSCRDYYIASSDSIFRPQFDVYGPYTLSRDKSYYGARSGSDNDKNARAMVSEACQMADVAGVNFKDYDTNNDGVLDNVFIYYAGHNEAEGAGGDCIWPHQGNISSMGIKLDGVTVSSYACTSEYRGASGSTRCGIGTFCHEFGHVIGLPDFYDTDYKYYSVGNWDIMCSGSYNNQGRTPPTFTAYERFFEGWLTPEQLSAPGRYYLENLDDSNAAYLIADGDHNLLGRQPSPSEFFILEYRDGTGWSKGLPGKGMLVWHIDYSSTAWAQNNPNNGPSLMRMHMEEANGITWQRRSNGEDGKPSDPYPGTSNVTSWTPKLHNGTVLNQPVFDISESDGLISFIYISEGGSNLRADKDRIEVVTTIDDDKRIVNWEPQAFVIQGTGLDPEKNVTVSMSGTSNAGVFYLFSGNTYPARTSTAWRSSITLKPEIDSTLNKTVYVSYIPKQQNCNMVSSTVRVSSSSANISLQVAASSPRPVYVTVPQVKPTTEVTPYSFCAAWMPVEDAERYYLTVYQIGAGTTDFVQTFENFNDPNEVALTGWQSTTNRTTSLAKADGMLSLYLKDNGDRVVTENYPAVVTSISYWINAFTADIDTIGVLYLDAWSGATAWIGLQETVVTSRTKQKTITCDINPDQGYTLFRLTFEAREGGEGLALDAFTATVDQQITYLYRGSELAITAVDNEEYTKFFVSGLKPASVYYWRVQCTDLDKGCVEHLTDLSAVSEVMTLDGLEADNKYLTLAIDSINYDRPTHTVYVANPAKGDVIGIFDYAGHLVYEINVSSVQYYYEVPIDRFTQGALYTIKYMNSGSMRRKQQYAKFVF